MKTRIALFTFILFCALAGNVSAASLYEAVKNGDEKAVNKILRNPENAFDVFKRDKNKRTPLHVAAKHGHEVMVRILTSAVWILVVSSSLKEKGHPDQYMFQYVNLGDNDGDTALHIAATYGRVPVIKTLIERKAKVNARNKVGATPLHLAAILGRAKTVKALLSHGANPNAVIEKFEVSVLDVVQKGMSITEGSTKPFLETIKILEKNGAKLAR